MDYKSFWEKNGLSAITPKGLPNPEGFDIGEVLKELVSNDSLVEIGCGIGRLSGIFDKEKYIGVDINPNAIDIAKNNTQGYDFRTINLEEEIPNADTALLYTVCLHIPDDIIDEQLKRFSKNVNKVIIAEIMNSKYRAKSGEDYNLSNQRELIDYIEKMDNIRFSLKDCIFRKYMYYEDEYITFAVFERY